MKRILILLLSIMAVGLQAQNATATITLRHTPEGARVVVSEAQGGRLVPTDTLKLDSKGRIKFKDDITRPKLYGLSLDREKKGVVYLMMLPKERMSFDLDWQDERGMASVSNVKGSDNMALYARFSALLAQQRMAANPNAFISKLEAELTAHPDLLMSAFLVTYFEQVQPFDRCTHLYKQVRDALYDRYANNELVQYLDRRLQNVVAVGMEARDIALPDREGNMRRLSDLRGHVVLIDFWASWCRPCRMENPNVVRLYKQYHPQGFEIFSVSLDNSHEAWLQAIEADGLEWDNHVSDLKGWQSAGGKLYGINSIPATVLVDAEGKIIARNLRGAELEQKLKELFQ